MLFDGAESMQQVFSTIELLTLILENCGAHDLLCSLPLINHTFKVIIDSNTLIQQRLFFVPLPENDTLPGSQPISQFRFNPFLKYLAYEKADLERYQCDDDGMSPTPVDFEPVPVPPSGVATYLQFTWSKIISSSAFARPDASWKRMLPIQPASSCREIFNHWGGGNNGTHVQPAGIRTLGETLESVKRRFDAPFFLKLRTVMRGGERLGLVVIMNATILSGTTEEWVRNLEENDNGYTLSHLSDQE